MLTNENALIAYVDLMGISAFYQTDSVLLSDKAERIYGALLHSFLDSFRNSFEENEHQDNYSVHIYADSILLIQRKKDDYAADKLLRFLMKLHRSLAFGVETGGISMPSRAILTRGEIFSLHIEKASKETFNRKLTSISICGGRGMIESDNILKRLPVGVYSSTEILSSIESEDYKEKLAVEGEDLCFVKQSQKEIQFYILIDGLSRGTQVTLKTLIEEGLKQGGIRDPFSDRIIQDNWYPWIDAHENRINTIKRL